MNKKKCKGCGRIMEKPTDVKPSVFKLKKFCTHKCRTKQKDAFKHNFVDLSGTTIGRIKIICDDGVRAKGGNIMWLCECYCGKRFHTLRSRLKAGLTKSCGCYRSELTSEMCKARVGVNHPNWNPEISQEDRMNSRNTHEIAKWRRAVYERDGYRCVICSKDRGFNAHHLDGYHWCKEGRFDVSNGVTLCEEHHKDFHKQYGRKNNTRKQFMEFLEEKTYESH